MFDRPGGTPGRSADISVPGWSVGKPMRRDRSPTIAGLVLVAMALTVAGCGEDPALEQGTFPFKGTDTSALAPLREEMTRKMQAQVGPSKDQPAGTTAPETPPPPGSVSSAKGR